MAEIRGFTKRQLKIISACLETTFSHDIVNRDCEPEINEINNKIKLQLKNWNGHNEKEKENNN